jgi:hypothetical protein
MEPRANKYCLSSQNKMLLITLTKNNRNQNILFWNISKKYIILGIFIVYFKFYGK